jgi:hypothetical protein
MKKINFLVFFFLGICEMLVAQSPFKAGNIVILRVGPGGAVPINSNTTSVFMDEYTTSGGLVQSISLPTTLASGNNPLTIPGTSGDLGYLTLSPDGKYLAMIGYNQMVGTSDVSAVPRTVGIVDYNGVINTTTSLTDIGTPQPLSAVTSNGTDFWIGILGGGIRYSTIGASTSTIIATSVAARRVSIYNGQLFDQSGGGSVRQVGTGLPISGPQTVSTLPGLSGAGGLGQFFMADLNPAIPGNDVLYRVNEVTPAIEKYSFDGTTWATNGVLGVDAEGYKSLAGSISGNTITLYMVRKATSVGGGELVTLTDNSGYGGPFSGTPALLTSAPANTAFRGIAMVPQPLSVSLSTKTFLQGAYNTSLSRHKNVTATWASVLNASALNQPYNAAPFNYVGTESVSAGFFTADDGVTTDIVDWVLVELHDATTPSTIIARKACFIREDGQIVDLDKVSNPTFTGVGANNYYVVIKHRNHLPIRSATTVFVNGATPVLYDFTTAQAQAFQNGAVVSNAAMKDFSGVFCMWGGNVNANNNTKYTGPQNDALALLALLGANQAAILSNVYSGGDVNMDGTVRYTGPNNDALALLAVLSANQAAVINEHQ